MMNTRITEMKPPINLKYIIALGHPASRQGPIDLS